MADIQEVDGQPLNMSGPLPDIFIKRAQEGNNQVNIAVMRAADLMLDEANVIQTNICHYLEPLTPQWDPDQRWALAYELADVYDKDKSQEELHEDFKVMISSSWGSVGEEEQERIARKLARDVATERERCLAASPTPERNGWNAKGSKPNDIPYIAQKAMEGFVIEDERGLKRYTNVHRIAAAAGYKTEEIQNNPEFHQPVAFVRGGGHRRGLLPADEHIYFDVELFADKNRKEANLAAIDIMAIRFKVPAALHYVKYGQFLHEAQDRAR